MMNRDRLIYLFSKLRNKVRIKNKYIKTSNTIINNVQNAYFFNKLKTICVYNNQNSISLNKILLNNFYYLKNIFVFPKLKNNILSFYHISSPEDLIVDEFGIKDISPSCFKIDISEIDVILVSGLALDKYGNWLHSENNTILYNKIFNRINKTIIGISLECQIYNRDLPETKHQIDGFLTEEGLYNIVNIMGV